MFMWLLWLKPLGNTPSSTKECLLKCAQWVQSENSGVIYFNILDTTLFEGKRLKIKKSLKISDPQNKFKFFSLSFHDLDSYILSNLAPSSSIFHRSIVANYLWVFKYFISPPRFPILHQSCFLSLKCLCSFFKIHLSHYSLNT